jgi:hypothetical protein
MHVLPSFSASSLREDINCKYFSKPSISRFHCSLENCFWVSENINNVLFDINTQQISASDSLSLILCWIICEMLRVLQLCFAGSHKYFAKYDGCSKSA